MAWLRCCKDVQEELRLVKWQIVVFFVDFWGSPQSCATGKIHDQLSRVGSYDQFALMIIISFDTTTLVPHLTSVLARDFSASCAFAEKPSQRLTSVMRRLRERAVERSVVKKNPNVSAIESKSIIANHNSDRKEQVEKDILSSSSTWYSSVQTILLLYQ